MKANLKEKYQLTKSVELLEHPYLGKQGIEIIARVHGEEVVIEGSPADAALILLKNQLIDDCSVGYGAVVVKWGWIMDIASLSGEHIQQAGISEMCWEDFVQSYNFTEFDAKQIVANYILNRPLQQAA